MARLGKKPVEIPAGVTVTAGQSSLSVSGTKGSLTRSVPQGIRIEVADGKVAVINTVPSGQRKAYRHADALQGMMRSMVRNMIHGVHSGFEKVLEIHGVGYRAEVKGNTLVLTLGFSHPVEIPIPEGITVEVLRNTILFIRGCDSQLVGEFTATVRKTCPPEAYKGKGIRYRGEYVRQKVGKSAVGVTK